MLSSKIVFAIDEACERIQFSQKRSPEIARALERANYGEYREVSKRAKNALRVKFIIR